MLEVRSRMFGTSVVVVVVVMACCVQDRKESEEVRELELASQRGARHSRRGIKNYKK